MKQLTPTEKRLNQLFNSLKAVSKRQAIEKIQECIWDIWSDSGCEKLNFALQTATEANQQKDYGKSIRILTKIIGVAPSFSEAYVARADAYFQQGELAKAMKDYKKALCVEPRRFDAMYGIASIRLIILDEKGASQVLHKALKLIPFHSELRLQLASLNLNLSFS